MNLTADVVIIGGGIIGASVAFHLAERGGANVIIVEREAEQGLGSTGAPLSSTRARSAWSEFAAGRLLAETSVP